MKRNETPSKRVRRLTGKLFGSPFFPILFIGEAVKLYVANGFFLHDPSPETARYAVMGVLALVIYVFGDDLQSEFENVTEAVSEEVGGEDSDAD